MEGKGEVQRVNEEAVGMRGKWAPTGGYHGSSRVEGIREGAKE